MKSFQQSNLTLLGRMWVPTLLLVACLARLHSPSLCNAADPPAEQVTEIVNRHLHRIWSDRNILPAEQAGRATFHRRLSLDLLGRIPTSAEAREFARSDSGQGRAELVARFVSSAAFSKRASVLLRQQWFPQTNFDPYRYLSSDVERWITEQIQQRKSLNLIASELIAASYNHHEQARVAPSDLNVPRTVIEANDHRAEQMANNVTASFLGVNLACAQCHDHPSGQWTQDEFWQTAAFFQRAPSDSPFLLKSLEIEIPGTDRRVGPALFTGESLSVYTSANSGRATFAHWMSDRGNPYFSRHIVNHLWGELFGRPLVDSLDETSHSTSDLEQLLCELALAFVDSDFDYRALVSGIVLSDAYQLDSRSEPRKRSSDIEKDYFQVARVRGLSGSQVYDSLRTAAGLPLLRDDLDSARALAQRKTLSDQLGVDATTGGQRSISQTLAMLNGELTHEIVLGKNPTIVALATSPFLSEDDCVESLYWATLNRAPTAEERDRLQNAAISIDDRSSRRERYSRLFWLLANTIEFNTNH